MNNNTASSVSERPEAVRRVGVMTMGICLIITGVVLVLYLFGLPVPYDFVVRLSPLLLVILGVELLWQFCRHRAQPLRLDLWSMVICTVVILFAIFLTGLAPLFQMFGPEYERAVLTLEDQAVELCSEKLAGNDSISRLYADVSLLHDKSYTGKKSLSDLEPADDLSLFVELGNKTYPDKVSFAVDCKAILDVISALDLPAEYLHFSTDSDRSSLYLTVHPPFGQNGSAETLALRVNGSFYSESPVEIESME